MGYSFYGGKQGRTYNLVAHYDSIYQMVLNFQKGGSYTDANYNEYVIIDTYVNRNEKSNRENGIIYRRGLNYAEPFNPNNYESIDVDTHTIDENATETVTLYGENGSIYQDTDIITDGNLSKQCEVPRFRHFEYKLIKKEGTNTVIAEIYPKDFIRGTARDWSANPKTEDREYKTLIGDEGRRYEDDYVGSGALSVNVLVPKYNHYSYVLHQEQGVVKASISIGKERTDIEVPDILFNKEWSAFVMNPGGGAVYVGQIVGPQGESTEITMTDWDTFEKDYLRNPDIIANKGSNRLFRRPGYEEGIRYNDDIQYGWATIKDIQGNVEYAVISLDIPYTLFKYDVHSVSAYGPTVITVEEGEELPAIPENEDTYYYKVDEDMYYIWDNTRTIDTVKVSIDSTDELPEGRQVDVQKFYHINRSSSEEYYHYAPQYTVLFVAELPIEEWEILSDTYYYLEEAYDEYAIGYYLYDSTEMQWNNVNKLALYTTVTDVPEIITVPSFVGTDIWQVSRDETTGEWTYKNILRERADSQGHPYYKNYELSIPKGIHGTDAVDWEVTENFDLIYNEINYDRLDPNEDPTIESQKEVIPHKLGVLRVIQSTQMIDRENNTDVSFIEVTYYPRWNEETGEYDIEDKERIPIKRINKIEINQFGQIIPHYTDGSETDPASPIGRITVIRDVSYDERKHLVIHINHTDTHVDPRVEPDGEGGFGKIVLREQQLQIIDEIGVTNDKDLAGNKQFYFKYDVKSDDAPGEDDDPETHIISQVKDDIVAIKLYGDNIVVLYSDPTHRQEIFGRGEGHYFALPFDGDYTAPGWIASAGDVPNTNLFYWENLNSVIKGQHIFGNFESLAQLKEEYPNGFGIGPGGEEQKDFAGWVASVVKYNETDPTQIDESELYAYNYLGTAVDPADNWYQISSLKVDGFDPEIAIIVSEANGEMPREKHSFLNVHGYWLVSVNIPIATD